MDPIYNDPEPITINGQKFTCREIRYAVLRQRVREVVKLVESIRTENPQTDWGSGAGIMAGLVGNVAHLYESADGLLGALMAESTGVANEELVELPASAYFRLATAVLEAQRPAVEAFLGGLDQMKGWRETEVSTKPDSSRH